MSLNFWLTEETVQKNPTIATEQAAWCCPRVRPAGLVRHHLLSSAGVPVERCSRGIRPGQDALQSLQALV